MAQQKSTCKLGDTEAMERKQQVQQLLRERMGRIDQKLLVMSGKGGVGKSTVAVNLALALARAGRKVGLLDVDLHGPSVPILLGLQGTTVEFAGDQIVPKHVADNLAVMSIGFMLSSQKDAVIWRGPRKHGIIKQFLLNVLWGDLDFLIIDAPPGTGDEPLAVAELAGGRSRALVVTTPQGLAISDVRRSISFCRELSLPVAGLIENMSGLVCPDCGRHLDLFGSGGGEKLALEMHVPFFGRVPIDMSVVSAGDTGEPFIARDDESPAAQAFTEVIRPLLASRHEKNSA